MSENTARRTPTFEGETAFYPRVWMFGQYDSRGGASAVVADTEEEAKRIYGEAWWGGYQDDTGEMEEWAKEGAESDYIGEAEVVFVGTEPPESGEDVTYGREDVVDLVMLQFGNTDNDVYGVQLVDGTWTWKKPMSIVVIGKEAFERETGEPAKEELWPTGYGPITIKGERWSVGALGEDAFGLAWF